MGIIDPNPVQLVTSYFSNATGSSVSSGRLSQLIVIDYAKPTTHPKTNIAKSCTKYKLHVDFGMSIISTSCFLVGFESFVNKT